MRRTSSSRRRASEAFTNLHQLAGRWSATTESGAVITATYKMISGDSVRVESYVTASGKETMTVFHRDGAGVIATHYCPQDNQPPDHLPRLVVKFVDATHFDRIETYSANGKDETTTLHFQKLN